MVVHLESSRRMLTEGGVARKLRPGSYAPRPLSSGAFVKMPKIMKSRSVRRAAMAKPTVEDLRRHRAAVAAGRIKVIPAPKA